MFPALLPMILAFAWWVAPPLSAMSRPTCGPGHVHVRFEQLEAVTPRELAAATLEAERLLQPAGLDVAWHTPSPLCDARTVEVRLARCGHPGVPPCRPGVLGSTILEADGTTLRYAVVYLDRVRDTARPHRHARSLLLGRVLAHELVHALVGSHSHEETGLMRAAWTRDLVDAPLGAGHALTDQVVGRLRSAVSLGPSERLLLVD